MICFGFCSHSRKSSCPAVPYDRNLIESCPCFNPVKPVSSPFQQGCAQISSHRPNIMASQLDIGPSPDYVIVGGGTAGLVLASRLSENPNVHVTVLEAGADRLKDPRINIPALWAACIGTELDWKFRTVSQVAQRLHSTARRFHSKDANECIAWSRRARYWIASRQASRRLERSEWTNSSGAFKGWYRCMGLPGQ